MKNIKQILVITLMISITSCTSSNDFEKGKNQLHQQGYTSVEKTGYSFFCCGEKDVYRQGFKAIDSEGNTVEGCLCSGVFKGVTIRIN